MDNDPSQKIIQGDLQYRDVNFLSKIKF